MDRNKVIKAVEDAFDLVHSDFIGTDDFNETEWEQNKSDALSLLKEQEAVEPKEIVNEHFPIGDYRRTIGWLCGKCGKALMGNGVYCSYCGKKVNWE